VTTAAPAQGADISMPNVEFYDDATAIRAAIPEIAGGDQWNTLDGRKLQGKPTKKGLYILNGKKTKVRKFFLFTHDDDGNSKKSCTFAQ